MPVYLVRSSTMTDACMPLSGGFYFLNYSLFSQHRLFFCLQDGGKAMHHLGGRRRRKKEVEGKTRGGIDRWIDTTIPYHQIAYNDNGLLR